MNSIAVVGAGVAGSIVAEMIKNVYNVKVYDIVKGYVKPCGEVVPKSTMLMIRENRITEPEVIEGINIFEFFDAEGNLLRRVEYSEPVWLSIDKTGWINRLREGLDLAVKPVNPHKLSNYSIVVDARGPFSSPGSKVVVWRAFARTRDFSNRAVIVTNKSPFGIAWIFGHGDVANIGGGFVNVSEPRRLAQKMLEKHIKSPLYGDAFSIVTLNPVLEPYKGGNVIAAGEAAGFIQSLGGEGIRPAVESAVSLAKTILEANQGTSLEALIRDYMERTRGLALETRISSLLLTASRALGPAALRKVSKKFFDLWLGGNLRNVRVVLSSLYL